MAKLADALALGASPETGWGFESPSTHFLKRAKQGSGLRVEFSERFSASVPVPPLLWVKALETYARATVRRAGE